MTEFISRNYAGEGYEVIIRTDDKANYTAAVDFARRLIDHEKPAADNNVGCKWISVEDQMPEMREVRNSNGADDTHYWISGECLMFGHGTCFVGSFYKDDKRTKVVAIDEAGSTFIVTHWMPLPLLPKEGS